METETVGRLIVALMLGGMGWVGTLLTQRYNDLRRRVEMLERIHMLRPPPEGS